MHEVLYYGSFTRYQTEQQLVVEYHFTIGVLPIAVSVTIHRDHNNATFEQLLQEAVGYARTHYTMLEASRGN